MAIDTLQKRSSALNVGTVLNLTLPPADSSIGQADRQHTVHHYSGILAGGAVAALVFYEYYYRHLLAGKA